MSKHAQITFNIAHNSSGPMPSLPVAAAGPVSTSQAGQLLSIIIPTILTGCNEPKYCAGAVILTWVTSLTTDRRLAISGFA